MNSSKRRSTADLHGYTALVTGGRLKVGFETALKLLRCGARVVVTTRFVDDARRRFSRQVDFGLWEDRVQIRAADFRLLASVEGLIGWVGDNLERLDILVNNAAQTVRHPPVFYRHLIRDDDALKIKEPAGGECLLQFREKETWMKRLGSEMQLAASVVGCDPRIVAQLSQVPLMPGDEVLDSSLFPEGRVDEDEQQEDRRDINSWMLRLEDIHLVEFLEVMYINLVAPFLLCSRLKSKMKRTKEELPSFIVNVTAMEGNFHDPEKNCRHPHTNMAKAGLNMMTRTTADQFRADGILMNSVDPGWITNERPFPIEAARSSRKTRMAIDAIDGASRICDPIFQAINDRKHFSGLLFKNYMVYPW